ncbi:unnamed protein product [Arabis nemorensis]|uniref:Uncharacterized protein n=1 Tax=Arabis nemorensis TaxID=586526 RepID=A0A565BE33_9BRAS|nr:unnamed protein product [Arabis nemorensis]
MWSWLHRSDGGFGGLFVRIVRFVEFAGVRALSPNLVPSGSRLAKHLVSDMLLSFPLLRLSFSLIELLARVSIPLRMPFVQSVLDSVQDNQRVVREGRLHFYVVAVMAFDISL